MENSMEKVTNFLVHCRLLSVQYASGIHPRLWFHQATKSVWGEGDPP